MLRLLAVAILACSLPASAVTIDWVYVGDGGNTPDTAQNCFAPKCGSVPYAYYISKYEVTNAQYAEFLNAVAATDTHGLYGGGGISRSGTPGSYSYAAQPGQENKPVVFVSFYDSLRFANWLNNGQPTGAQGPGTTEDGAYTIDPTAVILRNEDAIAFVPNENEWYKAAYYDSALGAYFDYPTGTNSDLTCVLPADDIGNSANCWPTSIGLTDVGAYALSISPYGTFDQAGNVDEWTEQLSDGCSFNPGGYCRVLRGGAWVWPAYRSRADINFPTEPTYERAYLGFRVGMCAGTAPCVLPNIPGVPEPSTSLLVATGLLGVGVRRRAARGALIA